MLIGLLVRLIVMPFTTHSDLLSVYHRAHLILGGASITKFAPDLFNLLHAGYLWLLKPLLPYSAMWSPTNLHTYVFADWLGFVNNQSIFRILFLFKFQYLVFELLAVWLLLKLVPRERAVSVTAFWMMNPIVIFSTYIFGRFDIIIVFLLLSALYLAREDRPGRAMLVLGLATLLRVYPVILVLPFAMILGRNFRDRARLAMLGLLPLIIPLTIGLTRGPDFIRQFTSMTHLTYPLLMKFSFLGRDNLYVFVLIYFLLLFNLYIHPRSGYAKLQRYSFYVMATLFATSFFHPHYFMWLMPFITFYVDDLRVLRIHHIQIGAWAVLAMQWGRSLAGFLLAPLSPAFFWALASPLDWVDRVYPSVQFIGIGRSLLAATLVAMAYVVWLQTHRGRPLLPIDAVEVETGVES